jgi:hypothetical protein
MSTFLTPIAIAVSIGILVIQYRNQVERRHGEIAQLKTQIMALLFAMQSRVTSLSINTEVSRILVSRAAPDCDLKSNALEKGAELLKAHSKVKADVDEYLTFYQNLQTQKANRSKTLLDLQSLAASLQTWAPKLQKAEEQLLSVIERLREREQKGTPPLS